MRARGPVLVDTSVWIDFFAPRPGPAGQELRRMISAAEPVTLTGIVVTEILQGLRHDAASVEKFLELCNQIEPEGFGTYVGAAALYRQARSHALTLTTVDAILATLAIENRIPFFTLDKDFERLSQWAPLALYTVD